ncbi:MAG: hypothetical protein ACPG7F_07680 [Aggregatilineales bacterium]
MDSKMPLDEFEAFIRLPENIDRHFEFINGQIVEKSSTPYASQLRQM